MKKISFPLLIHDAIQFEVVHSFLLIFLDSFSYHRKFFFLLYDPAQHIQMRCLINKRSQKNITKGGDWKEDEKNWIPSFWLKKTRMNGSQTITKGKKSHKSFPLMHKNFFFVQQNAKQSTAAVQERRGKIYSTVINIAEWYEENERQ